MNPVRTTSLSLAFAMVLITGHLMASESLHAQQIGAISLDSNYDGIFSGRDELQLTLTRTGSTDAELTVTIGIAQTTNISKKTT